MELLLLSMTGLRMAHVPCKDQGPAMADVVAGHVPLMLADILNSWPHIMAGRLSAYGVTSARRATVFADVPTIAEAGVPGCDVAQW